MQHGILTVCALLVTACAQEPTPVAKTPPPPSSPWIEGNFKSVSSADIRAAIAVMRVRIRKEYGASLPIYKVYVIDRDNMSFEYWQRDIETHAYVKRVNGSWQIDRDHPEVEIVRGYNIPTG